MAKGRVSPEELVLVKSQVLKCIAAGMTVAAACAAAGRSERTYELWRKNDHEFATAVDSVRVVHSTGRGEDIGFSAFSERYLGARVFPHMQNVVDLLEGAAPSWVAPGMAYDPGESDLIVVNMPPEHAKTTSITINYSTYRVATNPNIRIIVISKTLTMAQKMLYAIKTRLTHEKYLAMQTAYGPTGGFSANSAAWNATQIYLSDQSRDSGEKDPTVQALGIRGHVYGARADLIILDDPVDNTNAHDYQKQIDWIQSEVMSRLSPGGALLVVGTRLAPKDLYSELLKSDYYPDDNSPFTYLSMPAVLEFDEKPENWVTLWPRSNQPEVGARGAQTEPGSDGLFPKWDGPRLAKRRARMSPRTWAQVYMQQESSGDEIFAQDAIKAVINGQRHCGTIQRGMPGNRANGMDGLQIVAGLDPASPSGYVAAVCIGLDIATQKRYILDVFNKTGQSPEAIRNLIKGWTDKYRVVEWRIEKNAFQTMLTQDLEINQYLAGAGSFLREHFTGSNKWDVDFGVSSLTMLFQGWEDGRALVELPALYMAEGVKALVEQLVTWYPGMNKRQRCDTVMALWFAELACRDRVRAMGSYNRTHAKNPFATPWDLAQRQVVNLADADRAGLLRPMG